MVLILSTPLWPCALRTLPSGRALFFFSEGEGAKNVSKKTKAKAKQKKKQKKKKQKSKTETRKGETAGLEPTGSLLLFSVKQK